MKKLSLVVFCVQAFVLLLYFLGVFKILPLPAVLFYTMWYAAGGVGLVCFIALQLERVWKPFSILLFLVALGFIALGGVMAMG